jgi:hypothetical protein
MSGYFMGALRRHQTAAACLFLVAVLHACFFPFIWGNKTLLASARGAPSITPDGAYYGGSQGPAFARGNDKVAPAWLPEPDAVLGRHQYLDEKHLPLWNPYLSYGAPLAADMQSQAFYPLFLLYALHPGPRTYNLFILARFFLAGLFTYLYLRMYLPFVPSIAGGIACMLSGYYILFYNMPELSVSILVPALFLSTERLLRAQGVRNLVLSALTTFLCIVGGMPEVTFLVLAFGGAYFLFRLAAGPHAGAARATQLKYFLFAQAAGMALAALLLVPFFELMKLSFDSHQPSNMHGLIVGLNHDLFGISIFTYLIPAFFGPAQHAIGVGLGGVTVLRGFMGVVQILFAVLALGGVIRRGLPGMRRLTLFFLASTVAIILKRYGAPVINWIGHLPFCQLIVFPKYEEPLLAFAVAVLCAFGMHRVITGMASRRQLVISISVVFAILAAALAFSLPAIVAAKAPPAEFYLSLTGACAVLFGAVFLLLGPEKPALVRWLPAALLILLVAEMGGNYIYPVYYVLTQSAGDDANPYRGAPYIDYLKSKITAGERVVGRDGILSPNWAASFQIGDIRGVDALYYRKYFALIRFFLREEISPAMRGDLVNSFTGERWLPSDSPLKQRLLQLSSVRFLLSARPYQPAPGRVQEMIRQNEGRLLPGKEKMIEAREFTVAGQTRTVLYEHPPYERLPYRVTITSATRRFSFGLAMQPAVYDGSMPMCGDGVEFRLEIRDAGGRTALLYDRYIDPKHKPEERKWIDGSVDLSGYLGQNVELLFTTTPGPAGDTCMDWAGWGDPHFSGDTAAAAAFQQVYDREVKIYEYSDYVPRAALFSSVELAPDDHAALVRLGDPALDIFQTAVVSQAGLRAADLAAIQSVNRLPRERVRAARIVSYDSQEVMIDATVERAALLVLNDSDYPGWNVYVDGKQSHWMTANYLFRGVLLQPGRHNVRFAYEPGSFAVGAGISGAAALSLLGFAFWRRR